jgi:hypothetical protein
VDHVISKSPADLSLHLQAKCGEVDLTRCTLCKFTGSPASLMAPEREGAVMLDGPIKMTLQACYVEVGRGKAWLKANQLQQGQEMAAGSDSRWC